ncbi:MAG: discoidin domain-containing protein [Planctomycetota bacterium]|jgi:hypothetical protein
MSRFLIPCVVALACALPAAEQVNLVDQLELPEPQFTGTPRPANSARLEPPRIGPRAPIMIAAGSTNLAEDMLVSASDDEPITGELEMLTDTDKDGGFASFVEFGPGVQWVQVDLGEPATVEAVVCWHYHSTALVYRDVVVQVADDAAFTSNVRTIFNNDDDNSAGLGAGMDFEYVDTNEGKIFVAGGEQARFVRLYSNGNTGSQLNHYIEVEVWGTR